MNEEKTKIINKIFSKERDLYGLTSIEVIGCKFEGDEDGESHLKECTDIAIYDTIFSLRYPLWHVNGCNINNSTFNITSRAPLWYTNNILVNHTTIHSPKSIRECTNINIDSSSISSDEAFWNCDKVNINNTNITGSYLFFNSKNIVMENITLTGKYSLQYINDCKITNSKLYTKDAFWHAKDVVVKDSIIEGEYLGWYSDNLTLINCHIKGTQPLCYCKNLKIIDCTFDDADLAFENSCVDATIIGSILSIKNPLSGKIVVDDTQIIIDEQNKYNGNALVILRNKEVK